VPSDTVSALTPPVRFALRLAGWSLALFGLFRVPWTGVHIFLPATQAQAAVGTALFGPSSLPVEATLACSGADALALCCGAIAAYPVCWRMRAAGIAIGTAGILGLNTIRIGTLGRAAATPRVFDALHVYIWPAVLTIAIAGLVFGWMRVADRPRFPRSGRARVTSTQPDFPIVTLRFALAAAAGLLLFTLASPLYLASAQVQSVAWLVARASAALLRAMGVNATAAAGMLMTPNGAFLVTQECISTPLIPIYFAAVLVYSPTWRRAGFYALGAFPLFVALGSARLLVVALPAGLDHPPAFFIHAFFQFLVAAGMVCGLAFWRSGARASTWIRAVAALGLALGFSRILGGSYTGAMMYLTPITMDDPQGALTFLPAFQFGLFLALWVAAFSSSGWARFVCGASLLTAVQIAVGAAVQWLFVHAGVAPLVRDIRAWALIGPALVVAGVVYAAPRRR
jgi:exosortase/archaeosortase family protein